MTLDDFFVGSKEAWEKWQREIEEEKRRQEAAARQQRIDELKKRQRPKPSTPPATVPPVPSVASAGDYIKLENISCVDADGNKFEQYARLQVRKDIFRDGTNQKDFTPYGAVVHCEQQGMFLPSFALSCNILAQLYQHKDNPDCKNVLDQYKGKEDGTGYHAQNTIINFATQKIIHSPTAADFSQSTAVNVAYPRTEVSFAKETLQDELLETALQNSAKARYVKQLTGLQEPSVLIEIGKYFERPAKLWFPWNRQDGAGCSEIQAGWLGCNLTYFYLFAISNLNNFYAARGVHCGSPRSGAP